MNAIKDKLSLECVLNQLRHITILKDDRLAKMALKKRLTVKMVFKFAYLNTSSAFTAQYLIHSGHTRVF